MIQRLPGSRRLHALLWAGAFVAVASTARAAQTPTNAPPAEIQTSGASLEQARDLIKSGDNDRAVDLLKSVIGTERGSLSRLREAYLLLIETYVFLGNDYKLKPQGREVSNLNYKAARELIAECLAVKALRHTQPEPASEYPPEMVSFFAEVRAQMFGSFSVAELNPAAAVVLLDADTLRMLPGKNAYGDVDLAVGRHVVILRAPRYKDLTDEVMIAPSAMVERNYQLTKRHGAWWYVTRTGAAVGVTSLGLALRGNKKGPTEQPLPVAPPPPTQ